MDAERPQMMATLSAKVFNADGTVAHDLGVISEAPYFPPVSKHKRLWWWIGALGGFLVACAFIWLMVWLGIAALYFYLFSLLIFGLVTNAGVAFEASTFAGGTSTSAFNFHDSGTGTNAAAVTDTALQTPTGIARVSGTQSTPGSTNVYQTIATITYNATFAVTEWGLFSASSSGTLWDRRVFSAINVVNTNAIQFTYQLTIPSGGT
jgi:hypothetical protein